MTATPWPWFRWRISYRPTWCWSARARSCPPTALSLQPRRCWTSRHSPESPCRLRAGRRRTGAQRGGQRRLPLRHAGHRPRAESTYAGDRPPGPGGGSAPRPRSCVWPTAMPCGSCSSPGGGRRGLGRRRASRAVAVLVVATPCPLILAAPVALVSGLSRRGPAGHRHQRRRRAGAPGPLHHPAHRQDRHAHQRPSHPGRQWSRPAPCRRSEILSLAGSLDQVSRTSWPTPWSTRPRHAAAELVLPRRWSRRFPARASGASWMDSRWRWARPPG